ncbi:hypothetical protein B0H19DRAFT_1058063 [Mycena capillaripes]|nr:hypothetical protein B0H19DRAFT_1058063 [Mycena capillaripes]
MQLEHLFRPWMGQVSVRACFAIVRFDARVAGPLSTGESKKQLRIINRWCTVKHCKHYSNTAQTEPVQPVQKTLQAEVVTVGSKAYYFIATSRDNVVDSPHIGLRGWDLDTEKEREVLNSHSALLRRFEIDFAFEGDETAVNSSHAKPEFFSQGSKRILGFRLKIAIPVPLV